MVIKIIRNKKGRFIKGTGGNDYWKGKKQPKEMIEKRRLKLIGKVLSEDHKIKIGVANSIALMGRKNPEETKKKISISLKKAYDEGRRISCMKGKKHSNETKRKMSLSHMGKKISESTRKKHSVRLKKLYKDKNKHPFYGKKQSEETKNKIGKANSLKEHFSGDKHPNWKGGISFEPYDKNFNDKFRRAIRKRDNQVCMLCGVHREKLNRALCVHHINYDKKLTIPQNCISLCNNCHSKTSFNRELWINIFQKLMNEKYKYKYYESNQIIMELKE